MQNMKTCRAVYTTTQTNITDHLFLFHYFSRVSINGNTVDCSPVPKYKRDLVQKMKMLHAELSTLQPQTGHCRVEVSRENIFEVRQSGDIM